MELLGVSQLLAAVRDCLILLYVVIGGFSLCFSCGILLSDGDGCVYVCVCVRARALGGRRGSIVTC